MYEFFVAVTVLLALGFQDATELRPDAIATVEDQLAKDREDLKNKRKAEQQYLEWLTGNYIWLHDSMAGMGTFAISAEEYRANFTQQLLLAEKDEYPAILSRLSELRHQSDLCRNDILSFRLPGLQADIAELERRIDSAAGPSNATDALPAELEDDLSALGALIGGRDQSEATDNRDPPEETGVRLVAAGAIRDDCKTRFITLFRELQKFYGGVPRSTDVKADELTLRISEDRRATLTGGGITVSGLQADGQSIKMVVTFQFDPAIGPAIRVGSGDESAMFDANDVTEIRGSGTGQAVLSYSGGGQTADSGGDGPKTIHWVAKRDHDDVWYVEVKFQLDEGRATLAERFRFDFRLDGKSGASSSGADRASSQAIRDGTYEVTLVTVGYGVRGEFEPLLLGTATWKNLGQDFANLRIDMDPEMERRFQQRNIQFDFPVDTLLLKSEATYQTAGSLLKPLGRWVVRSEVTTDLNSQPENQDDEDELTRRLVEVSDQLGHGGLRLTVSPADNNRIQLEFQSRIRSYWFDGLLRNPR